MNDEFDKGQLIPAIHGRESPLEGVDPDLWRKVLFQADILRPLAEQEIVRKTEASDAATLLGCSTATVYRKIKLLRITGRPSALLPQKCGWPEGRSRLNPQKQAIIEHAIKHYYLTRQNIKISDLVDNVIELCRDAGVQDYPSRNAIKRLVDKVEAELRTRKRKGAKKARYKHKVIKGSVETAHVLDFVQIDHTLVDVMAVDPIYREPLGRPWITLAIDIYTRMIVGYYLTMRPPSTLSVAITIANMICPKEEYLFERGIEIDWPIYGPSCRLGADGAKEFDNASLERKCRDYHIDLQIRPKGQPHFGGHIERYIGTLMGEVKLLPGTTFANVHEKDDYDSAKHSCMTLAEIDAWILRQILGVYHQEVHSELNMPPIEAFRRSNFAEHKPKLADLDEQQVLLDFLPFKHRNISNKGIELFRIKYRSQVLNKWCNDGNKYKIVYDPRNMSQVYFQDDLRRFWPIPYANATYPPATLDEIEEAKRIIREDGREAVNEDLIFKTIKEMRQIVEEAQQKTVLARKKKARRIVAPPLLGNDEQVDEPAESTSSLTPDFYDFEDV